MVSHTAFVLSLFNITHMELMKFLSCFFFQTKAEKPFFSANHELDSLVSFYGIVF